MKTSLRWFIAALTLLALSCAVRDHVRQRETYANMLQSWRILAERLEAVPRQELTSEDAMKLLHSQNRDIDAWGNPLMVVLNRQNAHVSYLLISMGADGRLDVPDPVSYFHLTPIDIHGKYEHDIVLKDGEPLTFAGN